MYSTRLRSTAMVESPDERAPTSTRMTREARTAADRRFKMDLADSRAPQRLIVVSNRLPIRIERAGDTASILPGAGGLITALTPLMEQQRGVWVGWLGSEEEQDVEELLSRWSVGRAYDLVPMYLSKEEVAGYYHGFANQTIWPLFHDFLGRCTFERNDWNMYDAVNARFADRVREVLREDDRIWVHDYQLMLVGHHLRRRGIQHYLGFFLHIPFPSPDMFRRLPWRKEILLALLDYDLVGFQTGRDRRNFVRCVREFVPDSRTIARGRQAEIKHNGHQTIAGKFPISIDFREFYEKAKTPDVIEAANFIREQYKGAQLVLGVDRLDYSKGVGERYLALERALEKYPELVGKLTLIQVVVPSRNDVPEYQKQKALLDELAGRINGRFSMDGWVPIHYMYRTLEKTPLVALYRACDIALITPLRDGMNLVAKEYCASSVDGNGVLILSEFAGAANQLGDQALLVNPNDREGVADAIHQAFYLPSRHRQRRMRLMQGEIRRNDVHRWLSWILAPAHAR